jgi:TrmH family RNA methyltransferase
MPSRSQLKRWRALRRRKGRDEQGLGLAEGPRLLEELVASGLPIRNVLHTADAAADPAIAPLLEGARRAGAECEEVEPGLLGGLADTVTPQGVLALFQLPERGPEDLPLGDILVLDGIQDPGNLGTLVRTSEALGFSGVMAMEGTVDPWNPKAVRASAGSVFRVPVMPAERATAAGRLTAGGWSVWAADAGGEPLVRGDRLAERIALVLGNEGSGVSPELLRAADRRVSVAMGAEVESLNVAVAAAILMDRISSSRGGMC